MNSNNDNFINALTVVSFILGYENLLENRQQSADNDVNLANDKQAKFILDTINLRLDKQDKVLKRILERLDIDNEYK